MAYKCYLTGDYCKAYLGGSQDDGNSCPIGRYQPSDRYCEKGDKEYEKGAVIILDSHCRYYGIKDAKRIENKRFFSKWETQKECDLCHAASDRLVEIKIHAQGKGFSVKYICPACEAKFEAIFNDEEEE